MSNILKDIYQSYGYKENEVFKPIKIGCSMAGIEILDKLVKNAPASADTFLEIANLMAEQQNSIAKILLASQLRHRELRLLNLRLKLMLVHYLMR